MPQVLAELDPGFLPAVETLQGFLDRLKDPSPVMLGPVVDAVRDFWRRQWETSGQYGGEPWAPLSEDTIRRYGDELHESILDRTGILKASYIDRDALTADQHMLDPLTVEAGSLDPSAGLAQYGVTGRLPKRTISPDSLPADTMDRLVDAVGQYLEDGTLADAVA